MTIANDGCARDAPATTQALGTDRDWVGMVDNAEDDSAAVGSTATIPATAERTEGTTRPNY
ncbi:hypothetical protein PC116_g19877 [Phytophthora cactorum]|uniref:Uncharacterized protein n=1 Tax=Phytophthora cactorum TaxID=29920 RepID=A0A8T1K7V0_9STRA|nr:hypothetical protein Pcac1_g8841 [Phytophthora cactorum]KAG2918379.1 hypothetical protein PC117_g17102 [Phytophthora cactorum]KAG2972434.1 hypothetical protein PC118_g15695 [Phytophthora cactorum]KAG4231880.1 hypothetical protein PC116_g19877 [Phytophthora cactorum]